MNPNFNPPSDSLLSKTSLPSNYVPSTLILMGPSPRVIPKRDNEMFADIIKISVCRSKFNALCYGSKFTLNFAGSRSIPCILASFRVKVPTKKLNSLNIIIFYLI